jgi:homoserine O-succinyltransferase/O-acetyltransferase
LRLNKNIMTAAILDLNNNVTNRGVGYIQKMLTTHGIHYQTFDVRHQSQIPDTSFDLYISSGGPGSPFDMDGVWEKKYFALVDSIYQHNKQPRNKKKYVFFICHSFQLACMHFKVGTISERGVKSFGTFPAYLTTSGEQEKYFSGLNNPFYIADFRDWQVTGADDDYLKKQGFQIQAIERERTNTELPRAIMAVRFSPEMFGTQFHPEADAEGMLNYFQERERRNQLIQDYGMETYLRMIDDLEDKNKIELTHQTILPNFIKDVIKANSASLATT